MSPLTRRQLLIGTAATAAGAAASRAVAAPKPRIIKRPRLALPNPSASGIDHIVVLVMENRSFDHYLGWLPGAEGKQAGISYPADNGTLQSTFHLTDWQGCGKEDPDHSYEGGRVQLDGGLCDGFLKGRPTTPTVDPYSTDHYDKAGLPFSGPFLG